MKKILYIVAAIATLTLVSCEKKNNEPEVKFDANQIALNLTVASFNDNAAVPGRQNAVKNAWTNGDKINFWYDTNTQGTPDLVIKYDGSNWAIDGEATLSGNAPAASGNVKCLYEGKNNLGGYACSAPIYYANTYSTTESDACDFRMTVTCNAAYTYNSTNHELTATLDNWTFLSGVQVVVMNAPSICALKCDHLIQGAGFTIGANAITVRNGGTNGYAWYSSNDDGAAFYFAGTNTNSEADYVFTLCNRSMWTTSTYTVPAKTLSGSFNAIKIDYSKFN